MSDKFCLFPKPYNTNHQYINFLFPQSIFILWRTGIYSWSNNKLGKNIAYHLFMNGGVHPQSTLNHKKLEKKYHCSTYSGRVHPHENGREQLRTCQTPCLSSAWHLHVEMIHQEEIRNDKFTKCTRKFKRENFLLWPLPFQFKDLLFAGLIGLVNLVRL